MTVNGLPTASDARAGTWSIAGVPLNPGVNRLIIDALDENGEIIETTHIDVRRNIGSYTNVGGTITTDTTWTAAGGPYKLTTSVIVNAGATLTIEPGCTLEFTGTRYIRVFGTLIAEGTRFQRLRFIPEIGVSNIVNAVDFYQGSTGSILKYADIEKLNSGIRVNDGEVVVEKCHFFNLNDRVMKLTNPKVEVRDCVFGEIAAGSAIRGSGLPADGKMIFDGNVFGRTFGYNDIVDFSGGRLPGAIPVFINNVFLGTGDDCLDFDNTDAYIEGNTFMNVIKDHTSPSLAEAVATGGGAGSNVTVVRNTFVNVDHAMLLKGSSTGVFDHNTVVDAKVGGVGMDSTSATLSADSNIFVDVVAAISGTPGSTVVVDRSIMPTAELTYGVENLDDDPLFVSKSAADFRLQSGSPARGTGRGGLDRGALIPAGAQFFDLPPAVTASDSATIGVTGAGITHYIYRLDGGTDSAETPIATPITLTGLADGPHSIEVVGKNVASLWQVTPTVSPVWTVQTGAVGLRLNEVLASNATVAHEGTFPDIIELYNAGTTSINLGGISITDDPAVPNKYVFDLSTTILPGGYQVIYAAQPDATSGIHTGFSLSAKGEGVYLYDSVANGGALLDAIVFGSQLEDHSLSRLGEDGAWHLSVPTPDAANQPAIYGDASGVRLNEWLAKSQHHFEEDFVELYNPATVPVQIGGLYLSGVPANRPLEFQIPAHSYMAANGFALFEASGDPTPGPVETNFKLRGEGEALALYSEAGELLDRVDYPAQSRDVSQGRSPDGSDTLTHFETPTPGWTNALPGPGSALELLGELLDGLRVTELHYHPAALADIEFIELRNTGATTLDLSGVRITGGVTFTFPVMDLLPGEYVLVVANVVDFDANYGAGLNVAGEFAGSLSNGGETLSVRPAEAFDPFVVQKFEYNDVWYPSTDGGGSSLEIVDPLGDLSLWDRSEGWRASGGGGSPGNGSPFVDAGTDVIVAAESTFTLAGITSDDGLPTSPGSLSYQWQMVSGPNAVLLWSPAAETTSVTATTPGNYIFELVADDGASAGSDTVQVLVVDSYTHWVRENFPAPDTGNPNIAGALADPDADGWSNLLEYALDTNPLSSPGSSVGLGVSGSGNLEIAFDLPADLPPDLEYLVQASDDLNLWTTIATLSDATGWYGDGQVSAAPAAGSYIPITVGDLEQVGDPNERRFLRLLVGELPANP